MANVRQFGAKGDGKADDAAAIEKAQRTVCNVKKPEYRGKGPSLRWYAAVNEPALYFPSGGYVYTGKGLEGDSTPLDKPVGDGVLWSFVIGPSPSGRWADFGFGIAGGATRGR